MRLITCFLLGWSLLASHSPLAAAELLTFRGSFAPVKVEPGEDLTKTFELQLVDAPADGLQQAGWVLKESGRGAWPWTNRFGVADRVRNAPCLLYQRPDGYSIVPLPEFRSLDTTELKKDASWKVGPLTYRVLDQERRGAVDAWRVVGNNDYGPQRTLWIEPTTRLVVAGEERVFVGQGIECRLNWELAAREAVDAKQAAEWLGGFGKLAALRDTLAWQDRTRELKWTDEQLQTLAKELPALTEAIQTGPLALIVQVAKQDAKTQGSRGDALAALQAQAIGKSPTKFALEGLAGESLTPEKLAGQVTVLHFWDYKDSPLEEPYGQVGYLDFLARQRSKSGVQVYGVVVDERLDDRSTRSQAVTSARKVKAFMNLSYGVLFDESDFIKKIGDPRTTGAKLPLWVVLGKDGKVTHYHAGFYDVKRDAGLAELEAAVSAALK